MRRKFLLLKKTVSAFCLLMFVAIVSYAQIDVSKIEKEMLRRNLYTTTQNKNGVIFAGTWGAGIWKSSDDGNSWSRASEGLSSYDIRKLYTSNSNRIFAATSKGLYYSDDSENWNLVPQLNPIGGYRNIFRSNNKLFVIADNGDVFISLDHGQKWQQKVKIPEQIVVAPVALVGDKVFVGAEKGLYSSIDGCSTWVKEDNSIGNESIIDIYAVNGKLFVSTLSNKLYFSDDAGKTMSSMNNGLSGKKIKFISTDENGNILASVDDDGLYTLDQEREVWKKSNHNFGVSSLEFISAKKGKIIAGSSMGTVFVSENEGKDWNIINNKLICAIPNTRFIEVKASDKSAKSFVPPPAEFYKKYFKKTSAATVEVTYSGFSAQARTAFQYAVDIWSSLISSTETIRISAYYSSLGDGVLGSAGPATAYSGFLNQPYANTWYPVALSEKINGARLNLDTDADIVASFNSNFSNWYLGTDGGTPDGYYDFVSVVLHELCHGLGYVGSFSYNGGVGKWGDASYHYPYIFDRFLYNGSSQLLMNTGLFANPSTDLGFQLVGNDVWWTGPNAGTIRMYAPGSWSSGSSIYHLNETTYPPGSGNNLMTYAISDGEAIHSPGSIVLNQMSDMGWGAVTPITTYTISGTIKTGSNVAINGVSLNLTGSSTGSASTNASGAYSFSNLNAGGSYTITPTKTNYSFTPSNRSYSNLNSDQTSATFTGIPKPAVSLSSATLAYGDVKTSETSNKTLTITNSGLSTLTITALSFSGVDASSFSLVNPPSVPFTIEPAANQVLTIRFGPNSVSSKTATFTIAHDATGGTSNVSLTGNGTASSSTWSQNKTSIAFDSLGYMAAPRDEDLIVSNTSSGDTLSILSAVCSGSMNKFSVAETFPVKIAPNSGKTIRIRFNPDSVGSFSGVITMNNNSSNNPAAVLNVTGKVFGSFTTPNFSSVNYGIVGLGSGNKDTTIEIRNTGEYQMKITSVSISSSDASLVLVSSLPAEGVLVSPGGKYDVVVRLIPDILGTKSATIVVKNNSSNNPNMNLAVNAKVQQSYLSFDRSNVIFSTTSILTPSRNIAVVISNANTMLKAENVQKSMAAITVYDQVITGDTVSFKLLNKKTNYTISPGFNDTIWVQFFPRTAGDKTASLIITSNDLTPTRTISLNGTAGGSANINVGIVSVDYGDYAAGKTKDTSVIITNTGNLDLSITSKLFSGTDISSFSFLSGGNPKTLRLNESDTMRFRFTAALPAGSKNAVLRINSNDPLTPAYDIALNANIKYASISKSLSIVEYSTTDIGGKSDTTFIIKNTGNANLEISSISIDGAYAGDFILGANYNSTILIPGAEKTVKVSFIPSNTGLRYARLVIKNNDPARVEDYIILKGNGRIASLPSLSLGISKIEFGAVEIGQYRDTIITLVNSGNALLQIDSLNIVGAGKGLFTIINKTVPFSIAAGQSETFTLRYVPAGLATDASLRIKSNDNQKPMVEILLSGNVAAPSILLADSLLFFGNIRVSENSTLVVKISNTGNASLKIESVNINENSNVFIFSLPVLPFEIAPGGEYNLSVKFNPLESKNYGAIISIKSNDPNRETRTIAAVGTGAAPIMLLSRKVIDFGKVMNSDSKISGFRIANSGNYTLIVSGITISGTNASEFSVVGKTFPFSIIDGQSDSVSVKFSVNSIGLKSAVVKITTNDLLSSNEINISAEGVLKVSVDDNSELPQRYALRQNYPNPFNPSTKIKYSIKEQGIVSIKVCDVFGREVAILVNDNKPAGSYEINFDASNITSGIYFYTMKVNNYSETRKMILMK